MAEGHHCALLCKGERERPKKGGERAHTHKRHEEAEAAVEAAKATATGAVVVAIAAVTLLVKE